MAKPRRNYDQVLKDLLTRAHDAFLHMVLANAQWRRSLPSELPSQALRTDLLWEILFFGEIIVLHIELQTRPDKDMGMRLLEYGVRIYRQLGLKPLSIVVYLTPTENIPDSPFVVTLPNGEELFRYPFHVVKMWEQDPWAILNSPDVALWPLTPLMAGANADLVQHTAEQIATAPHLSRMERVELEGALAIFTTLRLSKSVIEQLSRSSPMMEELIKESGFYEWVVERETPRIESVAELHAHRDILLSVAQQRFGSLSASGQQAIMAATNLARLKAAILQCMTMSDEAALVAFLQATASEATE